MIECTSDIYCQRQFGDRYRCQEDCCSRSIKCKTGGRDEGTSEFQNAGDCGEDEECGVERDGSETHDDSNQDGTSDNFHSDIEGSSALSNTESSDRSDMEEREEESSQLSNTESSGRSDMEQPAEKSSQLSNTESSGRSDLEQPAEKGSQLSNTESSGRSDMEQPAEESSQLSNTESSGRSDMEQSAEESSQLSNTETSGRSDMEQLEEESSQFSNTETSGHSDMEQPAGGMNAESEQSGTDSEVGTLDGSAPKENKTP